MVVEGGASTGSADECASATSVSEGHHIQFARVIHVRPASLAEKDIRSFINQRTIKISQWVSCIPDGDDCPFKTMFEENYMSTMAYFVKAILAASLPFSVQEKALRNCTSHSLYQFVEEFIWFLRVEAPDAVVATGLKRTHKTPRMPPDPSVKKKKKKKETRHISQGKQQTHSHRERQTRPHSCYNNHNHNAGTQQNRPTNYNKYNTTQRPHAHTSFPSNSPRRTRPLVTNWSLDPDQCSNCCAEGHAADTCHSPPFCAFHGSRSHSWADCAAFPEQVKQTHHLLHQLITNPRALGKSAMREAIAALQDLYG